MLLGTTRYRKYYEASPTLESLGISLPPHARLLEISSGWGRLAVDVMAESLLLDGFSTGDGSIDSELHNLLSRGGFESELSMAIQSTLIDGAAYIAAYTSDNGLRFKALPVDRLDVKVDTEGAVVYAKQTIGEHHIIYTPGTEIRRDSSGAALDVKSTGLNIVPIFPLVNRDSAASLVGTSEIAPIKSLCDAASRSLILLQIGQEAVALPKRYFFTEDAEDLKASEDSLSMYFSNFLVSTPDAKAGHIPGADLTPIIASISTYAKQVSALTGIPPTMLGISTDSNPTSAEAMQAAKDRLSMRAARKQQFFGDALEKLAGFVLDQLGYKVDVIDAVWRDPGMTSPIARASLVLQAASAGVVSDELAREFLGLTREQLAQERERLNDGLLGRG